MPFGIVRTSDGERRVDCSRWLRSASETATTALVAAAARRLRKSEYHGSRSSRPCTVCTTAGTPAARAARAPLSQAPLCVWTTCGPRRAIHAISAGARRFVASPGAGTTSTVTPAATSSSAIGPDASMHTIETAWPFSVRPIARRAVTISMPARASVGSTMLIRRAGLIVPAAPLPT